MNKTKAQETLSLIASELLRDNIESLAICAVSKKGSVLSYYDIDDIGSAFELVGVAKVLTDRIMIATIDIPELGIDDEE